MRTDSAGHDCGHEDGARDRANGDFRQFGHIRKQCTYLLSPNLLAFETRRMCRVVQQSITIELKSYKPNNNLPSKRRVKRELVNGFG